MCSVSACCRGAQCCRSLSLLPSSLPCLMGNPDPAFARNACWPRVFVYFEMKFGLSRMHTKKQNIKKPTRARTTPSFRVIFLMYVCMHACTTGPDFVLIQHSGGMAYHSYSDDERMAFTEHINNCLAADPVSGETLSTPAGEAGERERDEMRGWREERKRRRMFMQPAPDTQKKAKRRWTHNKEGRGVGEERGGGGRGGASCRPF